MNTDKLKLFRSEDEIKSYASVNGYDEAGVNRLIAKWKSVKADRETPNKKFGYFSNTDVIETKNTDSF